MVVGVVVGCVVTGVVVGAVVVGEGAVVVVSATPF